MLAFPLQKTDGSQPQRFSPTDRLNPTDKAFGFSSVGHNLSVGGKTFKILFCV
jgi:hypothetical protein